MIYPILAHLRRIGWLLMLAVASPAMAGVVVIAHPTVHKLDLPTVQRIYAGKVIEVGGVAVNPVNLKSGQPVRLKFLSDYLQQTEDNYLAYWTVRRYVGKGVPPREFATPAEVIAYVLATPGAVAYLDETDVPPSLNIVLRR
jgi:hypothetical protein